MSQADDYDYDFDVEGNMFKVPKTGRFKGAVPNMSNVPKKYSQTYKKMYGYKSAKEVLQDVPDVDFEEKLAKSKKLYQAKSQGMKFPQTVGPTPPPTYLIKNGTLWYNTTINSLCIALPITQKRFRLFQKYGKLKNYPSVISVFKKGMKYMQWVKYDTNVEFYQDGEKIRCTEKVIRGSWDDFVNKL